MEEGGGRESASWSKTKKREKKETRIHLGLFFPLPSYTHDLHPGTAKLFLLRSNTEYTGSSSQCLQGAASSACWFTEQRLTRRRVARLQQVLEPPPALPHPPIRWENKGPPVNRVVATHCLCMCACACESFAPEEKAKGEEKIY